MISTSIELAWDSAAKRVKHSPPNDDEFVVFPVAGGSAKGCYGGVDSEGHVLLGIEVDIAPPQIEVRSASLDFFRKPRKGLNSWLMFFRLRAAPLQPVFGRLCQDLIDELQHTASDEELLVVVQHRIALWQKLFEIGPHGLLAEFQIKGLLAELLFIESQLKGPHRQPSEIVSAWLGPSGGDQDFMFSDVAIEIKAVGPHSEGVTISSLQQLESLIPIRLSIWTMRKSSASEQASETLNSVIARLEERLSPHHHALALFRSALLEAGYVAHPYYSEIAFEPLRVEEHEVAGPFPRLTPSSIPAGIMSATYCISLQHLRSRK